MKILKGSYAKSKSEKKKDATEVWKKRIMRVKDLSETEAKHKAEREKALAEHMLYAHAVIAYYKRNGSFQLVTGTLINYEKEFGHPFNIQEIHAAFTYWDEDAQGWRTFQIENFLEWKPIV